MKPTGKELKTMQRMQPGVQTLSGFLGDDTRPLNEIIQDDSVVLDKLGRSREEIAKRMESLTQASWDSYLEGILVEGKYQVQTEVYRGRMPCPFGHPGIYRKAVTTLTNQENGITVLWHSLSMHIIDTHCNF